MDSIEGSASGRYIITTFNGTKHLLDLDAKTVTRQGADGRAWSDDGRPFYYTHLLDVVVGKRMYAANSDHWKLSSAITSIEPEKEKEG